MVFTRVAYIPVIGEGGGEGELSQSGVEKSLYRIPGNNERKEFCWQSCGAFGLVHGCPLTSFSSTAVALLCRCRVVFGHRSLFSRVSRRCVAFGLR